MLSALRWNRCPRCAGFRKSGINNHNWLPFYEAVRRKWTADKKLISAVKKDVVLGKMLSSDVTFLEDRIFQAKKIDLTSRTFTPKKPAKKKDPKIEGFGNVKIAFPDLAL